MNGSQTDQGKPYRQFSYFGIALDPIHIGTGGYRLGRVDNTIARDTTTNLPILFGSSIEGTARTYSAYALIEDNTSIKKRKGEEKKYLECAGKTVDEGNGKRKQCGECEICVTYGFSNKERSLHGMAQFSDAKLLFFPVHTMFGPVWVTCPGILNEPEILGERGTHITVSKNKIRTRVVRKDERLNLGWIYLENEDDTLAMDEKFKKANISGEVLQRLVIVSDELFPHVVNSNLEVRTSVSIEPETGAAQEGALFTYEAIPRATVMYFTVTILDPKNFNLGNVKFIDTNGNYKDVTIKDIRDNVEKGLELFEYLGLGGMGTRGFGRFIILNLKGGGNGQ
jgi:CRISPR-associated protein Cmr4